MYEREVCVVFVVLIELKLQRPGPDTCFCYEQRICAERTLHDL